jgi:acetate kinase
MADAGARLLVLNAGSSSLKFAVYDLARSGPAVVQAGQVEDIGARARLVVVDDAGGSVAARTLDRREAPGHAGALGAIWDWLAGQGLLAGVAAVGHRVVHGGDTYAGPVRIDATVLAQLETLVPLAPLHQPHALAAIRAVAERLPGIPQVACFDTAFHQSQPAVARALALPRRFASAGVRRYGFHGLSYEYVSGRLATLDPAAAAGRVIVAHLGAGCSLCALAAGQSVATTMGFSTLDGLVMATRSGSLDPGVLLYLMDHFGLDHKALEDLLYHQSGLLGVSSLYGDVRRLLASNDARSREAIELFVYRINRELGSLAAALGGLDALVFTGGIGCGAAPIRAEVARLAHWLGVEVDPVANAAGGPRLSPAGARVAVWCLPTDENLVIARQIVRVLPVDALAPACQDLAAQPR